jgi:hypothetical protein
MGRPSSFTQETADTICRRLAGGDSLRKICSEDAMPDKTTVLRWLGQNESFRTQYARAREEQADHFAEEIVDIADEDPALAMEASRGEDEDAVLRVDGAAVARQRLRIDARKWFASKVAPKKYGDAIKLEGAGPNGEHLMQAVVNVSIGH